MVVYFNVGDDICNVVGDEMKVVIKWRGFCLG